jgi:hypothetical protein
MVIRDRDFDNPNCFLCVNSMLVSCGVSASATAKVTSQTKSGRDNAFRLAQRLRFCVIRIQTQTEELHPVEAHAVKERQSLAPSPATRSQRRDEAPDDSPPCLHKIYAYLISSTYLKKCRDPTKTSRTSRPRPLLQID